MSATDTARPSTTFTELVAPRAARKRSPIAFLGPLVVLAVVLLVWEYMHRTGMRDIFDRPGFLLPSPATVVDKTALDATTRSRMATGLGWTTVSALGGLAISVVLGTSLALAMSQARWIERSLYPYLVALQAVPILAVVPLILSVFGGGMSARVFVCVMISIFPIVSNTLFGLLSADPAQHDLFTLHDATRWTRMRKLQVPAALPAMFAGVRISVGLSVIGAIVGEQFFRRGAKPGIGIVMEQYRQNGNYAQVYGGLILACLFGILVFLAFGLLGRLVVGRWHDPTRGGG